MIPDIQDHSLPPLELTGHESLAEQFRAALRGPKPPRTPAERATRETEDALRQELREDAA